MPNEIEAGWIKIAFAKTPGMTGLFRRVSFVGAMRLSRWTTSIQPDFYKRRCLLFSIQNSQNTHPS